MPFREPKPDGDRLGAVIAIMQDMTAYRDALEEKDGPKPGKLVVRIIATAEMVEQACYHGKGGSLVKDVLMEVAIATAKKKCPLVAIESFLNKKLSESNTQFLH